MIEDEITSLVRGCCYYKAAMAEKAGREVSPYLFADEYGNFIHPDTFTKHLRKIFKENGFPQPFHLHTLRHYIVSSLLHHGVDKQTVAELLDFYRGTTFDSQAAVMSTLVKLASKHIYFEPAKKLAP